MRTISAIINYVGKPIKVQKCSPLSPCRLGFTIGAPKNNAPLSTSSCQNIHIEDCHSFDSQICTAFKSSPISLVLDTVRSKLPTLPRQQQMHKPFSSSVLSSSSSTSLPESVHLSPCNSFSSSINLLPQIPHSTLQTVRTLPEVDQVINSFQGTGGNGGSSRISSKSLLEGLERASQIFQHVGGVEYKAILLLKATFLSQCCRYNEAIQVLDAIISDDHNKSQGIGDSSSSENDRFVILSSLVKMHWYNGSFEKGLENATVINDMTPSLTSLVSLKQGCALNALALSQLLTLDKLQDVDIGRIEMMRSGEGGDQQQQIENKYSWQDVMDILSTLKLSSNVLENAYRSPDNDSAHLSNASAQVALACASSYCNQGIVDLICNIMQNRTNLSNGGTVENIKPFDSAMNAWRDGLTILEELDNKSRDSSLWSVHHTIVCKSMKARLYGNMAWAILFTSSYISTRLKTQPIKEDQLKIASEYSTLALKLYDDIVALCAESGNSFGVDETPMKPSMGKALGLVASCYARAGSAVTAEGLLQSAMDSFNIDDENQCPLSQIDHRSVLLYYSSLCSNWEKRETDALKNEELALKINNQLLNENFRGLSSIYSGLLFFTISDFEWLEH